MNGIWERPASLPGAGLFLFLLLSLPVLGCAGDKGEESAGARDSARDLLTSSDPGVHRVVLGGRGAEEHAVPLRVEVRPGDAVEFLSVDHRVHMVTFPRDSMSAAMVDFFEETGQGPSPPLVTRGSRFVLRLEGAPRGRFSFVSRGHGGRAVGWVVVGGGIDSLSQPPE